jgi:protein-tyrosine-phosphatase
VHPGAVAAADRAGLDLSGATPRTLEPEESLPPLVITVCDQAHEEIADDTSWLHWSVPDPVPVGTAAAFDATVRELRGRIESVLDPERAAS